MKIGILSRNRSLYSTRRLAQAGRAQGHHVHIIDTMTVAVEMGLAPNGNHIKVVMPHAHAFRWGTIAHHVKYVKPVDAIIPRIGTSITEYGLAVVRQFEQQQVLTTAPAAAIAQSRDKLRSMQLLVQHKLPIPKTAVIAQPAALYSAVQSVGGPPVIIKLIQGTQGKGVILARNLATAAAVMNKIQRAKRQALIQEFISESAGIDWRLIIVGDKCVAAMERQAAKKGEFRSNLHLGGTAVPLKPDSETINLAVTAAKAHGLHVAGVDIVPSQRGPLLLEINSSPGLEGIEKVTGKDIATHIIHYLESANQEKNRSRRNQ
ncbi:MAG: 30S ribosomal protein S6--L-glutamate ligase [Chloroflexi bacterium]|nr:MAG: 30S ribosomal protein S6--L-glutamate ligase [Chloroflexota bacterium]